MMTEASVQLASLSLEITSRARSNTGSISLLLAAEERASLHTKKKGKKDSYFLPPGLLWARWGRCFEWVVVFLLLRGLQLLFGELYTRRGVRGCPLRASLRKGYDWYVYPLHSTALLICGRVLSVSLRTIEGLSAIISLVLVSWWGKGNECATYERGRKLGRKN